MNIVTVRRVGNSNVITLPRALEELGYTVGTRVMLDAQPNGDIVVRTGEAVREYMLALARQVIAEDRGVLERLEAYDRGESTEQPTRHHPS
jgi:antitoxin component of MazEF toxin-antitoxin module